MEKNERETPQINIYNKEEVNSLATDSAFITFILEEGLVAIKYAIENNLKKIELVGISNLDCKIIIKKIDFNKILEKVINHFSATENYEKCKEIKDLMGKI